MIDAEQIIFTLANRDKPVGSTLIANADSNSPNLLPLITYDVALHGQTSNYYGLWLATVDFNLFGEPDTVFSSIVSPFYDAVHGWDGTLQGVVDDVGWVQQVDDLSAFSSVADVLIGGKAASQYAGSFSLLLRSN